MSLKLVTHSIKFAREEFTLINQRALFWPGKSILILSDLHLGKAAHFRKNGIAIPSGVNENDVMRLSKLIAHFQPEQVIFVGDLVHAKSNMEVEGFKTLTSEYPQSKFVLIQGNHDRLTLEKLSYLGISGLVENLQIGNITFTHQPLQDPAQAIICGHVHPGIRIVLPNKKALKLPCFVVSKNQIILPAFSLFTGLDTHRFTENAVFYAFDQNDFYVF